MGWGKRTSGGVDGKRKKEDMEWVGKGREKIWSGWEKEERGGGGEDGRWKREDVEEKMGEGKRRGGVVKGKMKRCAVDGKRKREEVEEKMREGREKK